MAGEGNSRLRRSIGWRSAAAVVVGNMIGTGIFTTSGFIARDTGSPWILLALWVAGGLIALTGALAYGELGAAMPEAGGEYVFLREAYGRVAAFLSGWTSFFAGFSGAIAAALLAFTGYIAARRLRRLFQQPVRALSRLSRCCGWSVNYLWHSPRK